MTRQVKSSQGICRGTCRWITSLFFVSQKIFYLIITNLLATFRRRRFKKVAVPIQKGRARNSNISDCKCFDVADFEFSKGNQQVSILIFDFRRRHLKKSLSLSRRKGQQGETWFPLLLHTHLVRLWACSPMVEHLPCTHEIRVQFTAGPFIVKDFEN